MTSGLFSGPISIMLKVFETKAEKVPCDHTTERDASSEMSILQELMMHYLLLSPSGLYGFDCYFVSKDKCDLTIEMVSKQ